MAERDRSPEAGGDDGRSRPARAQTSEKDRFFKRVLQSLVRTSSRRTGPSKDLERFVAACHELLSERGELSGARLAAGVLAMYRSLDAAAQDRFFDILVAEFSPDPADVLRAAEAYAREASQGNLLRVEAAAEPKRQELFRRFNMAPGGTPVLVDLRRQLLATIDRHPERAGVDSDLRHLFRSWFNRGFLELHRIDWRTSALVLERLIEYEAVHQIQGWRDLRRRLEADRRCFAFFHPALPDEPLIFIEVALTRGMTARVQPLLDPESAVVDPARSDTAIFYSITNCQKGLRGISFGNLLIKQVVEDLGREFPRVKTFATLSPIPGLVKWLMADGGGRDAERSPELTAVLAELRDGRPPESLPGVLRDEVMRLCAVYLMTAKSGHAPLDTVARFHLANGARIQRLNWLGDTSQAGIGQSLGVTANYVYRLGDVEANQEAYATHYRVTVSRDVERLLANRGRSSNRRE